MLAEELANALGAKRVGTTWMAKCPAHDDRTPSLAIREGHHGIPLVKCYAGCNQSDVIAALRGLGLWSRRLGLRVAARARIVRRTADPVNDKLAAIALKIWQNAQPASGTLAEVYLRSRGLTTEIPAALRFIGKLKHPSGEPFPAMVALVKSAISGEPVAIHRTYLHATGRSKANVEPQKMMLGPCAGGVVQLAPLGGDRLLIGEGIETSLSVMQVTGLPAWAALSTSGMSSLNLPDKARDIVILADGDAPGERAAHAAARRWEREGRQVRIARPPTGIDFNDLLMADVPANEEAK